MVFVSGTRLHLRSWRFFLPFVVWSQLAANQARAADGNLHTDLYRDRWGGYWTRTLWRDEAAMRAFMTSGAHSKAMRRHLNWADESYVVHWVQDELDVPSWAEVSRRMKGEGRRLRLCYPSVAHESFEVPELR